MAARSNPIDVNLARVTWQHLRRRRELVAKLESARPRAEERVKPFREIASQLSDLLKSVRRIHARTRTLSGAGGVAARLEASVTALADAKLAAVTQTDVTALADAFEWRRAGRPSLRSRFVEEMLKADVGARAALVDDWVQLDDVIGFLGETKGRKKRMRDLLTRAGHKPRA